MDIEIGRVPNRGLLPGDYYALPERQAARFGPDGLTLHDTTGEESNRRNRHRGTHPTRYAARRPVARREKRSVAVKMVDHSGDEVSKVYDAA